MTADLQRFQEKWVPVFRPKARRNKDLQRFQEKRVPIFRPNARQNKDLQRFQEKWVPVFRPNARQNKDLHRQADSTTWYTTPTFLTVILALDARISSRKAQSKQRDPRVKREGDSLLRLCVMYHDSTNSTKSHAAIGRLPEA